MALFIHFHLLSEHTHTKFDYFSKIPEYHHTFQCFTYQYVKCSCSLTWISAAISDGLASRPSPPSLSNYIVAHRSPELPLHCCSFALTLATCPTSDAVYKRHKPLSLLYSGSALQTLLSIFTVFSSSLTQSLA